MALIDRGTCYFLAKVLSAQAAGALAVVVVDNAPGEPFVMDGENSGTPIDIPAVMVSQADGGRIKNVLAAGVIRTRDMGGSSKTSEVGDAVASEFLGLKKL